MSRRATTIVAWALVAAAVAIRLFRADAQSLWYDEGTSAQLATRSAAAIVAAAARDIHPPLYYLLLAAWSRAFGHGVLALRALSAVLGAATVAATIAIGRRLGGRRVALVAGALVATSPYLIWYSQEVRMYVLAGFLGAALVVLALADADALADDAPAPGTADLQLRPAPPLHPSPPPRRPRWLDRLPPIPRTLLIAALVTAALYTQYLAGAAAVAIGGGAMALGWARAFVPSRRRGWRPPWPSVARWLAAMAIAAALFVPWLARAWPALRDWPALGAPVSMWFVARETLATYAFGIKAPPEWRAWWPVLAAVAFVGVAIAWWPGRWLAVPGRRARRWASAVALWMATAPPLLVYAASLRRPAWNPKFVIVGAPGFELLLALAVVGAAEVAAEIAGRHCPVGKRRTWTRRNTAAVTYAVGLALIVIPRLAVWRANAYNPAYQRDDYRGIAAEIAARAGPEDAVVLDAPSQVEVFGFYDRGAHATYPLPIGRPVDVGATEGALYEMFGRHRDVYGILWATGESDPDGVVEAKLNRNRHKADDRWFGNVRLATWIGERSPGNMPLLERSILFGDVIALSHIKAAPTRPFTGLLGYPLSRSNSKEPLVVELKPGDYVTLTAVWSAVRTVDVNYVVLTQLLDAEGRLLATRDMRPQGGTSATTTWRPIAPTWVTLGDTPIPDDAVLDLIALRIPPETPAGDGYRLVLGLYDPATGERLAPDTGGDAFEVARVTVTGR